MNESNSIRYGREKLRIIRSYLYTCEAVVLLEGGVRLVENIY